MRQVYTWTVALQKTTATGYTPSRLHTEYTALSNSVLDQYCVVGEDEKGMGDSAGAKARR